MSAAHTPGPWGVGRKDNPVGYFPIYARTGAVKLSCIAKTDPHEVGFGICEREHRANARLISAAPEMLHALLLTERGDTVIPHDIRKAIRAAIDKAEGMQP